MSHRHDKSLKTCHLSVAKRGLSWRMPSRNGLSQVKNSQFVKNLAICVKFPNLWKILQFVKNFWLQSQKGQFPMLTKLTMVTGNFIGWLTLGIILFYLNNSQC